MGLMRVSRGRRLGAIAVLAAMAVGGLWLGRYLHGKGLAWAANFSSVAAAVLAAVALLMPLLSRLVQTLSTQPSLSRTSIPQARDDLAAALVREWAEEERLRQINDPRPLPVRRDVTSTASAATATAGNATTGDFAGQFDRILTLFSRLSPSRLIILGRAGAGKSILVIKLARDLLATRQAGTPVPIILPAAAWDLKTGLPEWIADQLCRNHPGLAHRVRDTTGKVTTLALALVTDNMVLPIIDGLDELPKEQRSRAIEKINKFGSDAPLVLTSRPGEFLAAVTANGRGVARAAVVEILPLEVGQAAQYLTEATAVAPTGRWDAVFARLNSEPEGPLAHVLCTPLMLWLTRTVYETRGDPAELADQSRFSDVEQLEGHLLDALVPTVYAEMNNDRRFRCRPWQAERWLGFLAAHLDRTGEPDFAWWRLIRATPGWNMICFVLRVVLSSNALWVLTNWVLTRHGYWDNDRYVSHAPWHSILMGGPLGSQAWPAVDQLLTFRAQQIHHVMHVLVTKVLTKGPWPWNSFVTFEIVIAVIGIMLWVVTVTRRQDALPRRLRIWPLSVARTAVKGAFERFFTTFLLVAFAFVLLKPAISSQIIPAGFLQRESTWRALLAVAVTGATVVSVSSFAMPLDVSGSASPTDTVRLDQQAAWCVSALRHLLGTVTVWLWAESEIAAAYGLLVIIDMLIMLVLGRPFWAATGYGEARIWLYVRGRIPWRTLRFLADAHRRGVLRQTGAVYQFRHIRLQDRLAAQHPLMITRIESWAMQELLEPASVRLSAIPALNWIKDEAEDTARRFGWVLTVGPRGLRTYRDPRFDQLVGLSARDAGGLADKN